MEKQIILFDRQEITNFGMDALLRTPFVPGPEPRITTLATKVELVHTLIKCPEAVVVIDYTLSDLAGAESLLNIRFRFPAARWVLFSEELSADFLKKVLYAGNFGVVLKTSPLSEIRAVLTSAMYGGAAVCTSVKELLAMHEADRAEDREHLTATEKEILREIALGRSAKQIAGRRCMSAHTVTTHRKNIYRKLSVNNSQEAAGYALRAGIVDTSDYSI